ncbi:MAG: sugar efflux transporter [Paraburkholderia tropica]|uniref:SET family sugar efflux transporter-like MFS transporter n=1 Tax=Paraburkholderia tropica TaxID=92647 RepID=A0ABX5MID7_9BURK|nr:sugar efflux transporter [Paraburkholderia tropica]MDE1138357.1 sugar efflux transporter [Paraburkholderia tropica]PXX11745.1 SET family sugar efflux transporter-like MFS transporter [Paraburkholderia tropica]PZW77154.1 SET family sugar efflux transporter-like MFS transporter [Paraburkholderia tropica]
MLKNSRFVGLLHIPGFLPLAGATLMLGVAMSFTAPYLSLFGVERAGMTPLRLGLFMTTIAMSGVIASTAAGRWSDATGKHRPLLLASLCAATLGYISLCIVRDYRLLLVVGIAFIGAGGCALSLVFSFSRAALPCADDAERTFASATLRTILSAAWVFGPAVGALVLAATSFYGLFLFAAASFAACGFIVWRMREPRADEHATQHLMTRPTAQEVAQEIAEEAIAPYEGQPLTQAEVQPAVKQRVHPDGPEATQKDIMRAVVALTLIGLAANATMIVLPLYIVHGLDGTRIDVSIMLGLGAFMEIPMMLALGAKASKLNKPNWLAACAVVHAVYFASMAAAPGVHSLIPMQILNAFVVAVTSCLGMTYVQDLMPESPGRATALFFNASRLGSILSGVLSGLLVQAFGYRGTFLFCGVLALCALVLFAVPGEQYPKMARALRRFVRERVASRTRRD